jgi:hypothetical protein
VFDVKGEVRISLLGWSQISIKLYERREACNSCLSCGRLGKLNSLNLTFQVCCSRTLILSDEVEDLPRKLLWEK